MAARVFAYVVGTVYLAAGTFGFLVTGSEHWVEREPHTFLAWFRLNPTHNLLHLVLGATLLWVGTEDGPTARVTLGTLGLLYLGLGVAGLWLHGHPDWNVLAINQADNVLHFGTGAAAVVVALLPGGRAAR